MKHQIPNPIIHALYATSFKELATTLEIRSVPTNHRELGNCVFENLYNHCIFYDIGLTQLSREQGYPAITKSWMRGRLTKTTLTNRDLKIASDPTKINCPTLVAAKRFFHEKPLDIQILSVLFHDKVTLPSTHYEFIRARLNDEAVKETSEMLGLPRLFGRKFMKTLCSEDLEELVYRGLYQHCVSQAIDLSDLKCRDTPHAFSQTTVRWFAHKLATTPPSPHDTDCAYDPAHQKFRNLIAFKYYDHAHPPDIRLLALLNSHRTQMPQKEYEFIKDIVKCANKSSETLVVNENITAAKKMVATASNRYYEKRKSGMNPSPVRTKTRKTRLTVSEKKELARLKGVGFLDKETNFHSFQVLGFGGDHLSIVDGEEDKTAILPTYVLKNFIETELNGGRKRDAKEQIKRTLNPTRLLVRDKYLLLPNAKVKCMRLSSGAYEATLLEKITVAEQNEIQDELFAAYETREHMLHELEEEELDELNTCYV